MKSFMCVLLWVGVIPLHTMASEIKWKDCSGLDFRNWFEAPLVPTLQCGYLDVPLKYVSGTSLSEAGFGDEVRLALTRLPAKGVSKGALVVISGGPGISGIDSPLDTEGAAKDIHETWDIVLYDPRGIGRSEPKIDCAIAEGGRAPRITAKNYLIRALKTRG